MELTGAHSKEPGPVFPRRTFVAAALSAIVAGSAVGLAILGGQSTVDADTFQFSRGTTLANGEEARLRGFAARALADQRIHVSIIAHSGTAGDSAANLALSEERAATVADLVQQSGIPAERITLTGVGGGDPLPQEDGESDRAYQSRLARVDIALQVRR